MSKKKDLDSLTKFTSKLEKLMQEYGYKGILYRMRITHLPSNYDISKYMNSTEGTYAIITECVFEKDGQKPNAIKTEP